ncbi:MAG: hypothetical protein Q9218_004529 [Villophora microphyllina]
MAKDTTTIVFVPGLWVGPSVYSAIAHTFEAAPYNYTTRTVPLRSTGTTSPGNPSMQDDVQGIHDALLGLFDSPQPQHVLLVLHSAAGFLGASAMKGLSVRERDANGQKGGVTGIVFMSAGVFPEGFHHQPLPFMDFQGDRMYCKSPRQLLVNDLGDEKAEMWLKRFTHQPAAGWDGVITHGGWKDVPSVYVVCIKDQAVPDEMQRQCAAVAGSRIEICEGGHMSMLSQPGRIADIIREAANTLKG